MTDARLYDEVLTQVLLDGLGFGRGLDDDEPSRHDILGPSPGARRQAPGALLLRVTGNGPCFQPIFLVRGPIFYAGNAGKRVHAANLTV